MRCVELALDVSCPPAENAASRAVSAARVELEALVQPLQGLLASFGEKAWRGSGCRRFLHIHS
jgi:hypothetical protein